MRLPVMIAIVVLAAAGACRADDPLESLNTVEEALSRLAHHRAAHSTSHPNTPPHLQKPPAGVGDPSAELPRGAAPGEAEHSCCQEPPSSSPSGGE